VVDDERVERDDFGVGVENVEGELTRDEARDGRTDGVDFFLTEHRSGRVPVEGRRLVVILMSMSMSMSVCGRYSVVGSQ
jgi:hypothetical protein